MLSPSVREQLEKAAVVVAQMAGENAAYQAALFAGTEGVFKTVKDTGKFTDEEMKALVVKSAELSARLAIAAVANIPLQLVDMWVKEQHAAQESENAEDQH